MLTITFCLWNLRFKVHNLVKTKGKKDKIPPRKGGGELLPKAGWGQRRKGAQVYEANEICYLWSHFCHHTKIYSLRNGEHCHFLFTEMFLMKLIMIHCVKHKSKTGDQNVLGQKYEILMTANYQREWAWQVKRKGIKCNNNYYCWLHFQLCH